MVLRSFGGGTVMGLGPMVTWGGFASERLLLEDPAVAAAPAVNLLVFPAGLGAGAATR